MDVAYFWKISMLNGKIKHPRPLGAKNQASIVTHVFWNEMRINVNKNQYKRVITAIATYVGYPTSILEFVTILHVIENKWW